MADDWSWPWPLYETKPERKGVMTEAQQRWLEALVRLSERLKVLEREGYHRKNRRGTVGAAIYQEIATERQAVLDELEKGETNVGPETV